MCGWSRPDANEKATLDARDDLWRTDADACCDLRKVRPLARATAGFNAIITGRKRYQAATRARLKPFEVLDGVLRINPLANWDADDVETCWTRTTCRATRWSSRLCLHRLLALHAGGPEWRGRARRAAGRVWTRSSAAST